MKKCFTLNFLQKHWFLFTVMLLIFTGSVRADAASNHTLSFPASYTKELTLKKNSNKSLSVYMDGLKVSSSKFKWSSSKKSVVTVSKYGKLKAKRAGSATITIKLKKGKSNTLKLKVNVYSGIKKTSFKQGGNIGIKKGTGLTVQMSKTGRNTIFKTSNPNIFTVSPSGYITAVKSGSATLSASTFSGSTLYKSYATVTVGSEVSSINVKAVTRSIATLAVGEKKSIGAYVSPSDAYNKTILYSSSNPSVVSIDAAGNMTGKMQGSAVIYLSSASNPSVKRSITTYVTAARAGSYRNSDTFYMTAHRGLSASAPENTIPAFDSAADAGFKNVELDIRLSKDKELIVIHDSNLKKMCGINKKVSELTLEEIKSYPVIGGNNASAHPTNRLSTLEEVIALCNRRDLTPRIELKFKPSNAVLAHLMAVMETSKNPPILASFYESALIPIRMKYPNLRICVLENSPTANIVEICKNYHFELSVPYKTLTPDIINELHSLGIKINAGTITSSSTAEQVFRWGADSLSTNYQI